MEQPVAEPLQCPFCFSATVKVVASDQNKEAITIRCEQCGRTAEIDVENPNTTLNDPRKKAALPSEFAD